MDKQHDRLATQLRDRVFAAAPHAYLVLDPNLTIRDVNDRYLELTGTTRAQLVGRPLFEAFPDNPEDTGADGTRNLRLSLETVLETREPHRMAVQKYDIPVRDAEDGRFAERYWQPINTPVMDREEVIAIIHHVDDVTAEFIDQRDLAIKLRLATQISGIGYGELDLRTGTANVSSAMAELFGYSDLRGTLESAKFFSRVHPDDLPVLRHALKGDDIPHRHHAPVNVEYRIVLPDGEIRWLNTRGEVLFDRHGPARFVGATFDFTDIKRNEELLQKTLSERDLLLDQKEMLLGDANHRVKNSLQLVSSILRMQAGATRNDAVRASLETASSRVFAVSAAHELIYRSRNMKRVDIGAFVPRLVAHLNATLQSGTQRVEAFEKTDSLSLPTDVAISLGLLINELVTNSFKHAFAGREQGRVEVVLSSEDDRLRLCVRDDGTGNCAGESGSGLGFRIVRGIVAQLGATMKTENSDAGYGIIIEAPMPVE